MVRIYKQFWHPHEGDEYPDDNISSSIERILQGMWHRCDECRKPVVDNLGFDCKLCKKMWHIGCVPSSPEEINHPHHPYHPLKLLFDGPPVYSNGKCGTCQQNLNSFVYHCSICDYSMHVRCSKNPPPLIVDNLKCHQHTLTLMARNDTFTCNACGTHGEQCPYVCPPCGLMFHRDCITLPHVININRHDHRISHTYSLGFGDWKCSICHHKIDWRYGAYSCSTCPSYFVHSKCATRNDVWDGVELEGIPEEFVDISPFKVIEDGVINHFSHEEHNLRFVEDAIDRDGSVRCEACIHPIYYEKHYSCMKCDFILHETCANLPLRKRHWLCPKPLSLNAKKNKNKTAFRCDACGTKSNGFRYESGEISLDMRCASVSSYNEYECHPHTLFLTTLDEGTCGGCNQSKNHVLRCLECDFLLCFACATLPKKIKHKGDEHFLLLSFGEKGVNGKYWCEVCETLLDPQKWFYTCDVSGVTFHILCVLGEFPNAGPGLLVSIGKTKKVYIVPNGRILRPKCASCSSRCLRPFILKSFLTDIDGEYCCDMTCFFKQLDKNLS